MYLVAIAWMYVVVMMAVAEAASPQGTLLGAFFTFVLYGLLPLSIVMYLLGTPARQARNAARESQTAPPRPPAVAEDPAPPGLRRRPLEGAEPGHEES